MDLDTYIHYFDLQKIDSTIIECTHLIEEIKKHNINYEIKIRNKKDKMKKILYNDIDKIDINDVKSVEFFIKTNYGLHLALVKVV